MAATLALASLPIIAFGTLSQAIPIVRNPEKSFLWHTAPTGDFELRWVKPQGATSATLAVTGPGYSQTYENLTGDSLLLSLPQAVSGDNETVYELVLTFDDTSVLQTSLGAVATIGSSSASTMAINDADRAWGRTMVPIVIPVPCGVDRFEIDGVQKDTGLDGYAGWYHLCLAGNGPHALLAETSSRVFAAELLAQNGFMVIIR